MHSYTQLACVLLILYYMLYAYICVYIAIGLSDALL